MNRVEVFFHQQRSGRAGVHVVKFQHSLLLLLATLFLRSVLALAAHYRGSSVRLVRDLVLMALLCFGFYASCTRRTDLLFAWLLVRSIMWMGLLISAIFLVLASFALEHEERNDAGAELPTNTLVVLLLLTIVTLISIALYVYSTVLGYRLYRELQRLRMEGQASSPRVSNLSAATVVYNLNREDEMEVDEALLHNEGGVLPGIDSSSDP